MLPICTLAYHLSDDLFTICLDQTLVDGMQTKLRDFLRLLLRPYLRKQRRLLKYLLRGIIDKLRICHSSNRKRLCKVWLFNCSRMFSFLIMLAWWTFITSLLSFINPILKCLFYILFALGKIRHLLIFRSMWFRLAFLWLLGLEALAQGAEAPVWATSYSVQG
jgi:hypothetical protein